MSGVVCQHHWYLPFTMSERFVPVKKLRHLFDKVFPHPKHVANLRKVTELIRELQSSKDFAELRMLQQKLLKAISEAESQQREAAEKKRKLDAAHTLIVAEGRKSGSVDKAKLRELHRESGERGLEIDVLKRVRRQLRSVGDGLLWKAVRYNRGYVYAIWDGPGAGNAALSEPMGLAAELNEVERLWNDEGSLAVMHDLTNCGRVGDLTVVLPGGNIDVAEVKVASAVDPKQVKRMQDMSAFLRGTPKMLEGGYAIYASEPFKPSDHIKETGLYCMDAYARAVGNAGVQGVGWATVGNHTGLLAYAPAHQHWDSIRTAEVGEAERERLYEEAFKPAHEALTAASVSAKDTRVYIWDVSETQEDNLFGLPFSLYPFAPEMCAWLTCGYVKLNVFSNVTNLQRLFEERGFVVDAEDYPRDRNKLQFFWNVLLSKPELETESQPVVHVHLNKTLWQQVYGEALSIEAVIEAVEEEMKGKKGEGESFVSLLFIDGHGRRYKIGLPALSDS